ncbi:hypothetical protein [Proteus phage vB_PmiP_RS51pmB]|nr:hypothetical protein [Proteus phage vB_PmiP_RS51pmB]
MKLKCIHDGGCKWWTKGKSYESRRNSFGFLIVNDRIGSWWFLEDHEDGTYSPAGISYRVNFIIED